MPIYAFACSACGHHFDRLQKLSDPDPSACPVCGVDAIKRQLTAPSFRLAGSGWYETDFKKDSDKKRNLSDKPETAAASESKAAAPAATKSDAKSGDATPAAKPAAAASTTPAPAAKPASGGA
jgi:putative FmdB family regulatory protein